MADHHERRRILWQDGFQAVADRIEDISEGFPYLVAWLRGGSWDGCGHESHKCRQRAWECAERLAARPTCDRVEITSAPRRTRWTR